ncbi:fasciclin domain-containing protein [Brevundimonas variabilis]|uniref:Putative surface protein with fasciclin (FAS1) repeats n=1 Tax=Brevundimonas variabilis TaxID=74312 RepID=A0A7W9CJ41_9CAUL|nr:fasciclin domain-containing protein [Brevundimonas variabilis]MBB5746491.1 putative surface protein with fasciclin (FAS1) repeats [Brevundimonas variabilis]
MLRTRLLTATAAIALFAAPAAFAQDASTGSMTPEPATSEASAPQATTAPAQPTSDGAETTPAAGGNVIDTLKADGQFTTLLAALEAAQLTSTLQTQPAISIFAPTDAAFAALPEAERTRLMDPANVNELRQILLYHVIVADVNSSQIQGAKGGVETAARSQVQLDGTGSTLKIDDATIVQADIDASNGAVFIIDKVLSPEASQAAMGDEEALPAAADAATAPAADVPATPPATTDAPVTEEVTPTETDPAQTPPVEADADAGAETAPVPTPAPQA